MVLHLAEQLDMPLRERNVLLVAAGFAPVFAERRWRTRRLQAARKAVDLVLAGHEPYPALAVDRHWTLVAANAAVGRLIAGADPGLLRPPVNVLRAQPASRRASRRASPTSPNGAPTCSRACAGRSTSPPIPCSRD